MTGSRHGAEAVVQDNAPGAISPGWAGRGSGPAIAPAHAPVVAASVGRLHLVDQVARALAQADRAVAFGERAAAQRTAT